MNNLPVHRTACKLRLQVPPTLCAQAPGYLQRIAYGLLLTIAVGGLSQTATAADALYANVASWAIFKNTDIDTNACVMAAQFTGGTYFGLVILATGQAAAVVTREKWNIPKDKYRVQFEIDSKGGWYGPAHVNPQNPKQLLTEVPMKFVHEIAFGNVLRIEAGTWGTLLPLTNSKAAIEKTVECVKSIDSTSNPFVTPTLPSM